MKIIFAMAIVIFIGCAAPRYVSDDHQAGLYEPVILNPGCVLVGIDTVYNPLGGVVKVLHIKCIEKKGGNKNGL
jgi:hypothetical protein